MEPIGVAIDGRWMSAVQRHRGREIAVHLDRGASCGGERIDEVPSEAEVELFASVLERHRFVGRRVALAAPASLTRQSVLDLPPASSGAPLTTIAAGEMARLHKLTPGEFEVAVVPMAAPPRGVAPSSAVALAHDDAERVLAGFDACGLDVVSIEPASMALVGAAGLDRPGPAGAVLELGWHAMRIVVSVPTGPGEGGTPAYERTIEPIGLEGLHESLCVQLELDDDVGDFVLAELGVHDEFGDERDTWSRRDEVRELIATWAQRVASESSAAIDYAQQRFQVEIDRVHVCGFGTTVPGAIAMIEAQTPFTIETVRAAGQLGWLSGPAAGVGSTEVGKGAR